MVETMDVHDSQATYIQKALDRYGFLFILR
jgi:hypothetical protein